MRAVTLLLVLCAVAVAALAVGPFLYRSLLPEAAGTPATPCGFVAVTVGLFLLLVGGFHIYFQEAIKFQYFPGGNKTLTCAGDIDIDGRFFQFGLGHL